VNGRVTQQANPKNKFSFFYDRQGRCWCDLIVFAGVPPSRSRVAPGVAGQPADDVRLVVSR
jgi:hypothetical protein